MSAGTHNTQSQNLAARMGRWSAAHWKTATFGWLAFVLVAFGLGGMVGTRNIDNAAGPGESGRMDRILDAGFKQPAAENVLIQSRTARAGTAAFDAAIADVVARISKIAGVREHPLTAHPRQRRPHLEGRTLRARPVSRSAAPRTRRSTRSPRSSTA